MLRSENRGEGMMGEKEDGEREDGGKGGWRRSENRRLERLGDGKDGGKKACRAFLLGLFL